MIISTINETCKWLKHISVAGECTALDRKFVLDTFKAARENRPSYDHVLEATLRTMVRLSKWKKEADFDEAIQEFIGYTQRTDKFNTVNDNCLDFAIICQLRVLHSNELVKNSEERNRFLSLLLERFMKNPDDVSKKYNNKKEYDIKYYSPHTILEEVIVHEISDIAYSYRDESVTEFYKKYNFNIEENSICNIKSMCSGVDISNRANWALSRLEKSKIPNKITNCTLCHIMAFQPSPHQFTVSKLFDILTASTDRKLCVCILHGLGCFESEEITHCSNQHFKFKPIIDQRQKYIHDEINTIINNKKINHIIPSF